jgi:N-acetyl-alpha-D-muramate 1-phosphate uridylyltransferase
MMLPVVILAGGLGTRLGDLTRSIPKALVEVNGEPFLTHQLRLLKRGGVTDVVICIGHLGNAIESFAGDGSRFGVRIRYSHDGPMLLGTAGAVRRALPLAGENFFTMYGDSYLTCDYAAVASAFQASGKRGLMTVYRNEGRWDTSNVDFDGQNIRAYDKLNRRPSMQYIDYGLGAFHRSAFEHIPADQRCDLAELYKDLLREGELAAYEVTQRFYEVGSASGINELADYLSHELY